MTNTATNTKKKIAVIGAGFAGLSAATCLAQQGFQVDVYEKNSIAGGRARKFESDGFTFDMGPSWYWMPDVFEEYFSSFGKQTKDYFTLDRLDPSYRVYFGQDDYLDVPAGEASLYKLFERLEPGSSGSLKEFIDEGELKYRFGIDVMVRKPGLSWLELVEWKLFTATLRLNIFESISSYIRKFFKHPRLIQILEFPVLFLGAAPDQTPALYSLMNYADMALGTWYPRGGMYKVVEGMVKLAQEHGVRFHFNSEIKKLEIDGNKIKALQTGSGLFGCDAVVAAADYNHVEQHLLPPTLRKYNEAYWNSRILAPSSLLFYMGLNKKVEGLRHHTLFFDTDFKEHAREIYRDPQWPSQPQFYVSCTSRTDPHAAPVGCENLVILIPVAPGLEDNEATREKYFELVLTRLEQLTGQELRSALVFKRSYAHRDFQADYHSFKGNAYGLANTITQTANFKPSIINKKVPNLFYTGQLTVPGPGVPPAIISGQVVAKIVARVLR